ncbi:putative cofactor assembly of complex C subunit B, CCB1 [Helianthus annuus]|uniref:Cofactor assembly of complex C subunit B, CCB1 n=1 Tax=Helianthus annuus TaxID=4232 RepID=A0A251RUA3_HELAN|nr:protein COFACTOR ASSEMBLY OF COMPLEX C SUBUNIT B CCB1, chloroplastic [Helianthus annuus]KAF5755427.1 putative cofactor assembly of complex C subunit B, CCB1 [Helianthus annuus]KAJ0429154.1 putative cofactor assembly of complex C subunit B, CCB1 [Helianthus annuus]KAJ0447511.1 putative cofactor assembly of complex C subunit B, CCB1 [Helianthus annuus]KAJ0632387.1 putative cofactor assembly of complex C subunit B, CCB1 [Helianthus annuus]KAJ0636273.1 putative cofactor assembly of complex C su
MAVAKLLLPSSLNLPPSKLTITRRPSPSLHRQQPWGASKKNKPPAISASLHETATVAVQTPLFLLADAAAAVGYSTASYYTSLGLFVISVPGLWSLIKRSVKSKVVKKTFVEEEIAGTKKTPNQVAGEILSFFTRNNFSVVDRGETITFEGVMVPSRGQAALLTFCTCISLGSVALVLTITVPDFGNNWFGLTILSPLAGAYYWKRASRKEQIKVRMIVAEDGTLSEIIVQGDDQQVDQMRKELKLSEKGMVYVKGIFER